MSISLYDRVLHWLSQHMLLISAGVALMVFFAIICVLIALATMRGRRKPTDAGSETDSQPDPSLPASVSAGDILRNAILQGNKIEAIRLYRLHTGSSLLVAKQSVEAMEREMGI